jgi:hypothetical protein
VLLTAWAEQISAEARRIEGVWRILGKPVTLGALAGAIEEVCWAG